ncbi:hypothetical protein CR51_11640 [Caballeronia megalochromosomata]|nr:hypothetical protein CR51_11640 [Caballeronia megalochromosomata]
MLELLQFLVTDVASDVEVVARELGLKDEMKERLRRALDRVECAQGVLEAVCRETAHNEGLPIDPVMRAMEILARIWPQDYGANSVEWLVLGERYY